MNLGLLEIPKAIARQFRTIILGNPSGNPRGVGAVEIIPSRTANTQVANGVNSIAIGVNSSVTGRTGIAIGLNASSAGAGPLLSSGIAIGPSANASGEQSAVFGHNAQSTAQNSMAIGSLSQSTAQSSIAIGTNALANAIDSLCVRNATTNSITGYYAFGHSNVLRGRHQRSEIMLRGVTDDQINQVRLTSDDNAASATNQLTLRNNSAFRPSQIDIVAYDTVAGTATAWSINNVLIVRGAAAANTALVGTPTVTTVQNNMATAPTVTVSADTTNGALAITFTSATTNTTRYTAIIRTSEVMT